MANKGKVRRKRTNKPGQHYLLSAASRTFSLMQIFTMSDEDAFDLFKSMRWTDGDPVCPHCGNEDKPHGFVKTRKIWRCGECKRQFSLTSGTVFAYHKKPLKTYLAAIAIFVNQVKGVSMLQLSRDLNVQYKTAFVLAHKIRESIYRVEKADGQQFTGIVEIDGVYFNANPEKENVQPQQRPNKACVVSVRERGAKGEGAKRTQTIVVSGENGAALGPEIQRIVEAHAEMNADSYPGLNFLYSQFEKVKRVNHSEGEYVDPETGASVNQCESFNARIRRGYIGQHHKWQVKYLPEYASEFAFRDDWRRVDNGSMFQEIVTRCAQAPRSNNWTGYWQGNHKAESVLIAS